jgi:hypothetical protein
MLHAIFHYYNNNNNSNTDTGNVVEINVEDPAPGFVQLRNTVDYERFLQSKRTWFQCIDHQKNNKSNHVSDPNFFTPLKESQALEITKISKTTTLQVHIVYELDKLQQLQEYLQTNQLERVDGGDDDERLLLLFTRFRVMVKSRLNKHHREEMGACNDKTQAKALLAQFFEHVHEQYRSILHGVAKRRNPPVVSNSSIATTTTTTTTTIDKKDEISPRSVTSSGTSGEHS